MSLGIRKNRKRALNRRSGKRNEGVALILTLLFVVLLTVLVVEFAYEAQVEASYALNAGNDFQARLAARSAVYKGIFVLENDRLQAELAAADGYPPVDSRFSSWALPGEFEPLNDAVMRATITDEYGKINLNALVDNSSGTSVVREHIREALNAFFTQRGIAAGAEVDPVPLVNSIVDWIDDNDDEEEGGAESEFYEAAEIPYPCKNGPMDSIEELLLIKGMTPEIYFGAEGLEIPQLPISEFLTVHGDWLGRINPNTVHVDYETGISDVLEAMTAGWRDNATQPFVADVRFEEMVDYMLGSDEQAVFPDLGSLNGFVDHLDLGADDVNRPRPNQNPNQDPNQNIERLQIDVLNHMFVVHSHVFRIYGDALLDDILVRNEAYVFRVPQQVEDLEWPGNSLVINGVEANPVAPLDLLLNADGQSGPPEEFYRILAWKVIQ